MGEELPMPDSQTRHFAFIINPNAGQRIWPSLQPQVEEMFAGQAQGHTCEIVLTQYAGQATELAAELARRYGDRLIAVACGGDGTANEVANGITGTAAAMSVLPIGTANDFARAALSRQEPAELLSRLFEPAIRPIDVFRIDSRICLNITSLGFDSKVQRKAETLNVKVRWLGGLIYPLAIILALLGGREYPMHYRLETIDAQGKTGVIESDARFILAAICNGQYYGGGFHPAPQAALDDGRLDLCIVDCLPLRRVLSLIPRYKQGTHLDDPAVHLMSVTGGHIEAPAGQLLLGNYDGEVFEKPTVDFKILPQALRFAFY